MRSHLTVVLVALISTLSTIPLLHVAYSQEVSITTSADNQDGTFFGEGVLQIIINDPDSDDDSTVEEITVDIDADPDSGSQGSFSVIVPETSDSSGRFEFFLVHADATAVGPEDIDPINSAGVEGDGSCVSDCAPFVTFGASGDLQIDADLYEDVAFDLTAGNVEVTVKYEETLAQVSLDRSAYGSDSFVYVSIDDQDANLNPTAADEFIVDPDNAPNNDLLTLGGGSIEDTVTFRETGDNSARFEGRYELGASIDFDSESLVLTLFDKVNYGDTLSADENDSNGTDEVSFSIGDTDGTIDVGDLITWDAELSSDKSAYALGENVTITIEDPDANSNPSVADSIELELSASSGTAVIAATETGQSTGIFKAIFHLDSEGSIDGTLLELAEGESVKISYTDEKPADYQARLDSGQDPEKEFTIEIKTVLGTVGIPSASLSSPTVRAIGDEDSSLAVGTQLGLSTTIENDGGAEQPFVALIEVRDSMGITVYLAWQSGDLEPEGSTAIEVSWTPDVSGKYEVRTFAVSSLTNAIVLSKVATTNVDVS
jgi:hypothetical protein